METNTCNKFTLRSNDAPTDAERQTHAHTCKVGASDEQDATNEEREHSAIDSPIQLRTRIRQKQWLRHTSWYWQTRFSGNKITTKQHYHSTTHSQQLDYVLMNRALSTHGKDAQTMGQIHMNSNHKVVKARIELPTDHETQQVNEQTSEEAKRKRRQGTHRPSVRQPL